MEEEQVTEESSNSQNDSEKSSRRTKVLFLIVRLVRIFIIVGIFLLALFIFFKMSGFVYDRTQVIEKDSLGEATLDVYAQKPKTVPLETFDAGQYNFEIKTISPNEVNAFVKIHLALVYDPSTLEGYDPKAEDQSHNVLSAELEERKLQITDIFRVMLSQKTYEELKGTNGMGIVKKQLMNQINHILVNGKISDIYFTEWNIIPTGY